MDKITQTVLNLDHTVILSGYLYMLDDTTITGFKLTREYIEDLKSIGFSDDEVIRKIRVLIDSKFVPLDHLIAD